MYMVVHSNANQFKNINLDFFKTQNQKGGIIYIKSASKMLMYIITKTRRSWLAVVAWFVSSMQVYTETSRDYVLLETCPLARQLWKTYLA